jgi:pantoate--beta-alanine ligase
MGALHEGHISLINASKENNAFTVCSIFINPTQFNNRADFEKYPVSIEKDIRLLEAAGCNLLFLPSAAGMYPPGDPVMEYDLGYIENLLEGKYRPGHFQGVCRIVDKLLYIVQPGTLYLGQKDYQQCMVIKKMMELRNYSAHLSICETKREKDGLAMSSRNMRLNETERKQATGLIHQLRFIKENLVPGDTSETVLTASKNLTYAGFKVDYLELADAVTLLPVVNWNGEQKIVALAAAFLNEIRLIDNLLLN